MMTSNSFKEGFTMMILKQRLLNDGTKKSKKFHSNRINTVLKSPE